MALFGIEYPFVLDAPSFAVRTGRTGFCVQFLCVLFPNTTVPNSRCVILTWLSPRITPGCYDPFYCLVDAQQTARMDALLS